MEIKMEGEEEEEEEGEGEAQRLNGEGGRHSGSSRGGAPGGLDSVGSQCGRGLGRLNGEAVTCM